MADYPTFGEFFRAIHPFGPLPWQEDLAERIVTTGWPAALDIPTGLGKTSAIDAGIWGLGSQAGRLPADRTLQTRMWYVVNRRLLVDAAYEHAQDLAEHFSAPEHDAVASVARALQSIAVAGSQSNERRVQPLQVSRLRGGAALGARPADPTQPAVVFATVPMFASRWLFRGYGTSRSMRPVDAAHAGTDAVVLLDEAHLSRHLMTLGGRLAETDVGDPTAVLPAARARTTIVAMTATGEDSADAVRLTERDHQHEVVQQRIRAAKPTTVVESSKSKMVRDLVRAAAARLDGAAQEHATCVVFTNTARLATRVAAEARTALPEAETVVLTGRLREPDADEVRGRLLDPTIGVPSDRQDFPRDRPLVVVATQTLEVGADLDFDHLVTQSAGVRAITQRFGRLNRLGDRDGHAAATVVHVPGDDPVYGDEADAVASRLQDARDDQGLVNLSPARIRTVLGTPADGPRRAAELLPAHLWEWAKTTLEPAGEAPVEAFFDGLDEDLARISVCWRAWLPAPGERVLPAPSSDEVVEIPISEARDLIDRLDRAELRVLQPDGTLGSLQRLRPGQTVLLPCASGGYGLDGWDADSTATVPDVSIDERGFLALHPASLAHVAPNDEALQTLRPLWEGDADVKAFDNRDVVALIEELSPVTDVTLRTLLAPALDDPTKHLREGPEGVWVVVPPREPREQDQVRFDAFDDLSFDATSTALEQHGGTVGVLARQLAEGLGVDAGLHGTIELAGRLHDTGKAEPRFQRWLDPRARETDPLAKSDRSRTWRQDRARAGWPHGGRHELLSCRAVEAWLAHEGVPDGVDAELLLHLVSSHHGGGRPLVHTVAADALAAPFAVALEGRTVEVHDGLDLDDWDQPTRFRRLCERYGYWGLALLEALVRQADHAASAATAQQEVHVA